MQGTQAEKIQLNDGAKLLSSYLNSEDGVYKTDAIEIFLITLSATVRKGGNELQPRDIYFQSQSLPVKQKINDQIERKEILLLQKVIDLNFLNSVLESRGNRQPLEIDFEREFESRIEVIQAAQETNFESYLGVISADLLYNLYRR